MFAPIRPRPINPNVGMLMPFSVRCLAAPPEHRPDPDRAARNALLGWRGLGRFGSVVTPPRAWQNDGYRGSGMAESSICNLALVGHTGAGKTTLAEALLHASGA